MKFNLFSSSFWGLMLIIIGVLLLLRHIFDLDFPFFTLFFSLLLIFLGIVFIRGGFFRGSESFSMFSESRTSYVPGETRYSVLFGEQSVDLSAMAVNENTVLECSCVFGEMKIRLKENLNYEVISNVAFASVTFPNGNSINFGNHTFRPAGFDPSRPAVRILAKCVFGNMVFV